jgi:hypothetical protein
VAFAESTVDEAALDCLVTESSPPQRRVGGLIRSGERRFWPWNVATEFRPPFQDGLACV